MLGFIAFAWFIAAIDLAWGALVIPSLKHMRPSEGGYRADNADDPPRVSILFSARDEAEKLPAALASFLALDYPNYEVIAVDDRSDDATGTF